MAEHAGGAVEVAARGGGGPDGAGGEVDGLGVGEGGREVVVFGV